MKQFRLEPQFLTQELKLLQYKMLYSD